MTVSRARVVVVTLWLSLIGAVCGALLGALTTLTHMPPGALVPPGAVWPRGVVFRFALQLALFGLEFGALGGGVLGAMLTPIVGWIFLRRVTLDRAIRQTALGVAIGITVGAVFPLGTALALGLLGFVLAGGRLWWVSRRGIRDHAPAV